MRLDLPRSLMLKTPSCVDEVRLWDFLSLGTSFSVGAGAFSSCMDKPAMAESTLVRGTDMMDGFGGLRKLDGRREGNEKGGEGEGESRRGGERAGDQEEERLRAGN